MKPKYITIHCSATPPSLRHIGVIALRKMHVDKGWSDIGYHFVITRDGITQDGRPLTRNGAGVKGHNKDNIHICLVGGVDEDNNPVDNFTEKQFASLRYLYSELASKFGIKQDCAMGHRDWYGDSNDDGVIDSRDWLKECPCFDVQEKLAGWR